MILNELGKFKLFKDMPKEDMEKSHLHNQAFFKHREYPRFFQSYLYLKSERKYFYYGFIDDCFIIIKKQIQFKNYITYLPIPPISIAGDLNKELELINKFNAIGIKTRVSEEDIKLYNLNKDQFRKNKDDVEMIYSPSFYNNYAGVKLANFRYANNLKNVLINNGTLIEEKHKLLSKDLIDLNETLLKGWQVKKRTQNITSKGDMCHRWFNDISFGNYYQLLNGGKVVISSITENILPNKIILDTNYLDYTIQLPKFEAVKAMHVMLMNDLPNKAMVNSGSGGFDKGLTSHKRFLKPCKELQIYDTVATAKITEEVYNCICKGDEK